MASSAHPKLPALLARPTGWRRGLAALAGLSLMLAACATSSTTTSKPAATATPTATAPAQVHGALYVVAISSTSAGATSATVSALSLTDGTQLWQDPLSAQSVTAALGGGTLYLAAVQQSSSATPQGLFEAVNASTGASLWRHTPASGLEEPLAASSDVVFVVDLSFSNPQAPPVETLKALRASDGTTLWSAAQSGMLGSNATIGDGALYVISAANPTATSPMPTSTLLALDTGTGMPLWHSTLPGSSTGNGAPILSNGVLYLSAENGTSAGPTITVLAVRASDGTVLWHAAPPSAVGGLGGLVVSGGTVCYSYWLQTGQGGGIVALHAADGSASWHASTSSNGPVPLASDGSAIYALTTTTSKTPSTFTVTTTLLAFGASSGASLLTKPFPTLPVQAMYGQGSSPQPAVAGGVLYVVGQVVATGPGAPSSGGIAVALSTHDASLVWQHALTGNVEQVIFVAP